MIKGKYLITAGIAAAVLALTACSGGRECFRQGDTEDGGAESGGRCGGPGFTVC